MKELERRKELSAWCNSRILIDCKSDSDYCSDIENSQARVADFNKKVNAPYREVLYRPGPNSGYFVKWNIVGFPCKESAESVGMSLEEYSNFVYSATIGNDWNKIAILMKKIKSYVDFAKEVRIFVPGQTDLSFSLADRGANICEGRRNMPDGEVYYGPIEDSINGEIYFQPQTKREGFGTLSGIKLKFEKGLIVDYSAEQNQKALEETFKIDEGARRIGEFGIGCNYGIKRVINETLFDEKIGGTIHLALGSSFSEHPLDQGGGLNKSLIHWDIVCDLRKNPLDTKKYPGGEIYVNGKLLQKDGEWLF
jgi:aminopeptidase